MPFSEVHILTAILLTPLFGAIVLSLLPSGSRLCRHVANGFGMLPVLMALSVAWRFHAVPGASQFQFVADHSWIPSLGARYTLGVDGLSFLMVLLTAVLGAIAIGVSTSSERDGEPQKVHCALLLLLETCLLGVFLSLDFILFYFFWEAALVPAYFLIAGDGSERRANAAMKFFLCTLAGSVVMLLAILAICHSRQTFDMREILARPFGPADGWHAQKWLFWGFFFAFAIKAGMFPFHSWLPEAHAESSPGASVLLAGAALNMGVYGFLRVSVPMLPGAASRYQEAMIVLSILGIIYGGFLCLAQRDVKRLIAYSSLPLVGFCTLGIFTLTPLGIAGGVIQLINEAVVVSALFLIFGIVCERRGTRSIEDLRGGMKGARGLAGVYLVVTLAALGMPLLSGFIGEFAVLRGTLDVRWQWAAWAVFGILLLAAVLLSLYQRIVLERDPAESAQAAVRPNRREWIPLVALTALAFGIGVVPQPLFRVLAAPVNQLVVAVNPGYYVNHPQESVGALEPSSAVLPGGRIVSVSEVSKPVGTGGK